MTRIAAPRCSARRLVVPALALVALTACGQGSGGTGTGEESGDAATGGPAQDAGTTVTVFAAASLTEVFDEIAESVEDEQGATIEFSYAGSSALATQLTEGAPGSVFASASDTVMQTAVDGGAVVAGAPRAFATNTLTLVTPAGNPAGVTSLDDLAGDDLTVVVCAPQVPCGAATQRVTDAAGVELTPASEEQAVTDVLGKVTSGQADAGLVYVTDAVRAGDQVDVVAIPEAEDLPNVYEIALTTHGGEDPERRRVAEAFVAAVSAPEGQAALAEAGFGPPPQ